MLQRRKEGLKASLGISCGGPKAAERALEVGERASKAAKRASEAARINLEATGRVSVPARRALETSGRAKGGLKKMCLPVCSGSLSY